jgi:hypothetical protein
VRRVRQYKVGNVGIVETSGWRFFSQRLAHLQSWHRVSFTHLESHPSSYLFARDGVLAYSEESGEVLKEAVQELLEDRNEVALAIICLW